MFELVKEKPNKEKSYAYMSCVNFEEYIHLPLLGLDTDRDCFCSSRQCGSRAHEQVHVIVLMLGSNSDVPIEACTLFRMTLYHDAGFAAL